VKERVEAREGKNTVGAVGGGRVREYSQEVARFKVSETERRNYTGFSTSKAQRKAPCERGRGREKKLGRGV